MVKKMQFTRFELFKIIHSMEIYIFLGILFLLNFIFAYLFGSNSNILILAGTDKMGGMLFYIIIYSLLTSLLLFPIIIVTTTAGIWSKEFANGTIAYSIVWAPSRKYIFIVKCLETIVVTILYNIFFIASAVLLFVLLGRNGRMYSSDVLYGAEEQLLAFILIVIMYSVYLSALSTVFSMFESSSVAIIGVIATTIVLKILEQVDFVKRFIPTYVINPINTLDRIYKMSDLNACIIYTILLSGGLYAVSFFIFKRKNIK